jgi:hypothetical protein
MPSPLVRDAEGAHYFKQVFEFYWNTLAEQQSNQVVADVRVPIPGEATPPGFRCMSMREALGAS